MQTRNHMKGPFQFAGFGVEGENVARVLLLLPGIVSRHGADDDNVTAHHGRGDGVDAALAQLLFSLSELLQADKPAFSKLLRGLAGLGIQSVEEHAANDENAGAGCGCSIRDPAGSDAAQAAGLASGRRLRPNGLSGGGVKGFHQTDAVGHIHHPVHHERRGLVGIGSRSAVHALICRACVRRIHHGPAPDDLKLIYVGSIYLIERRILQAGVCAAICVPFTVGGYGIRRQAFPGWKQSAADRKAHSADEYPAIHWPRAVLLRSVMAHSLVNSPHGITSPHDKRRSLCPPGCPYDSPRSHPLW